MGLFKDAKEASYVGGRKHYADVIKNRSDGTLLVSRAPEEDFNDGSTLVVMPGEAALFVRGGNVEQVFGEGTYRLSSDNYPFLSRLRNALTGGVSAYSCVVYFVRLADGPEVKWGTAGPLQVRDKVLGVATSVRSYGAYRVAVIDPALFLTRLIGNNVNLETALGLERYFADQFQEKIRSALTFELNAHEGELLGIEAELEDFAGRLKPRVDAILRDYGLACRSFSVSSLEVVGSEHRDRFDKIGMDSYETISAYRAEKRAMDELGPQWAALKQVQILEKGVSNPGGAGFMGDVASIVAGTSVVAPAMHDAMSVPGGVGQAPGAWAGAHGQPTMSAPPSRFGRYTQVEDPAPAVSATPGASTGAAGSADDRRARLMELESYFKDGLITEEEYAEARAEVIRQIKGAL